MNRSAKKSKYLCLIERFSTSKYLNKSKKEYYFLSKNEWFQSPGEDIGKYLKKSPEEINLLRDFYFHCKRKICMKQ